MFPNRQYILLHGTLKMHLKQEDISVECQLPARRQSEIHCEQGGAGPMASWLMVTWNPPCGQKE